MKKSRVTLTCQACNKAYEVPTCRAATSSYCSKECWKNRNPPRPKECPYCEEVFTTYDENAIYCSRRCAGKDRTGERASRWIDGKSLERQRGRLGTELKEWRNAVYIRDHYTCQICGAKGKIQAHHIKPWVDYPDLRFDVTNGITLCIDCHGKEHNIDFANRRKKICPDCNKPMSGRGQRCRLCALTFRHRQAGHRQPRTCPQCRTDFIPCNSTRIYCSRQCAGQAKITTGRSIGKGGTSKHPGVTVKCSYCAKEILRYVCQVETSKTGKFFCSEDCKHFDERKRVLVSCSVCSKEFTVKSYRVRDGKQVTCSRACGYKHISLQHALTKQAQCPSGQ